MMSCSVNANNVLIVHDADTVSELFILPDDVGPLTQHTATKAPTLRKRKSQIVVRRLNCYGKIVTLTK